LTPYQGLLFRVLQSLKLVLSPLTDDGGGGLALCWTRHVAARVPGNQTRGKSEMRCDSRSLAKAITALSSAPAHNRGLGKKVIFRRELCLIPTTGALFVARRLLKSPNAAGERTTSTAVKGLGWTSPQGDAENFSNQGAAPRPRAAHVAASSQCSSLQ